jgi:hypothetical protein
MNWIDWANGACMMALRLGMSPRTGQCPGSLKTETMWEYNEMTMFKYGNFEFDSTKVPQPSIDAMLRRGFGHYMGSECASKVTSAFAPNEQGVITPPEGYTADDAGRAQYKADVQAKAFEAFLAGTVGAGVSRGPKLDPVDAAFASIVKREVVDKLKTLGLKFPKGDEVITFADGAKRTGEEMIANWSKNHGERIRKEAEKHVKELERKRQKMEADAKAVGGTGAEAAGL